jgi:hypothetical protein
MNLSENGFKDLAPNYKLFPNWTNRVKKPCFDNDSLLQLKSQFNPAIFVGGKIN